MRLGRYRISIHSESRTINQGSAIESKICESGPAIDVWVDSGLIYGNSLKGYPTNRVSRKWPNPRVKQEANRAKLRYRFVRAGCVDGASSHVKPKGARGKSNEA